MIEFEFDPSKSQANKEKHGIDFIEGQLLWDDIDGLEVEANINDEPRFLVVAKISQKYWTAVITYRGEKVRIISIRASRKNEKELYEST